MLVSVLAYVWYHSGYTRITVNHRDFTETTNTLYLLKNHVGPL
jgi:hypothetical protein